MADIDLTITIPDAKVAVATQGYLKLFPNTDLVDPADPESGLKYTTKQWVQEKMRRDLARDVRRGRQLINNEASVIPYDDEVAI